MDTDLAMVLGITIACFSVPSLLSAFSDRRAPRAPALIILIATGLIVYASTNSPGGYQLGELPGVFARVIRQLLP
jgi:hypothetical protein